jgi:hypothetical protein
MSMAQT